MKEFIVSYRVDGRIDIKVKANNVEEAFEKAKIKFETASLRNMEVVDSEPVNAYDVQEDTYTDM